MKTSKKVFKLNTQGKEWKGTYLQDNNWCFLLYDSNGFMARVHQFLPISLVINFNLKPWLLYKKKSSIKFWPRILDRLTTGSDLVCPAQLNVLPKKFQQFEGKGRLREPSTTHLVVSQGHQTPSKSDQFSKCLLGSLDGNDVHTQAGILPRFKLCFRDVITCQFGGNEKCRVTQKWCSEVWELEGGFIMITHSRKRKEKRLRSSVANAAGNQMIKWCLPRACVARSWLLNEK